MNISKMSPVFMLAISLICIQCGPNIQKTEKFFPTTIDGVYNVSLSYHTNERLFSGNWSAPLLGADKKFHRFLGKGGGKIHFFVTQPEQYVLSIGVAKPQANLVARIKDKTILLKKSVKFLPADLFEPGENTILLSADDKLKVQQIKIYPTRILKYPNFKELLNDDTVLFLPGSLRYYIKPLPSEAICLRLNLFKRNKIKLGIHIRGQTDSAEDVRTIKNGQLFRITLLENQFQEVTLTPLNLERGYLRVEESFLIQNRERIRADLRRQKEIKDRAANKNVLIILLDATRNDHVGYNGYSRMTTPNIDQLAKNSLVFKTCYSEASYTLASTGTLLTGLPPDYHSVVSKYYSSLDQKTTTLSELFKKKGYFSGAISGNPNFGKAYRLDKGFSAFIELFKDKPAPLAGDFMAPFKEMLTRINNQPFFIYLHVREPHDPYKMPPPFLGSFQKTYLEQCEALTEIGKTFWKSTVDKNDDLNLLRKIYDENLYYGDWATGQIIQILEQHQLSENTIIIFISDHGEAIGENGLIGHAHVLYETGLRIPLVIRIPGVTPRIIHQASITSDLVLTLAMLFDLEYSYIEFTHGRNLFHLPEERRLFARSINIKNYPGYRVQQFPYKLIIQFPIIPGGGKLYNLADDPHELTCLTDHQLLKETLMFYLFNHLKNAVELHPQILRPQFRKEDLKSLESLGYL